MMRKKKSEDGGNITTRGRLPKPAPGARYALFIGDEGAILLYLKGNVVQSRQFVPDASEQNLKELRGTLGGDTKAPLLMVIDSMDQSYAQQTLPPVSSLSVNKLIKRRLERDFGVNDIKGAIVLGREKTGRRDWNFLMVSIERSRQLSLWLDFVVSLPNRFQGIYLVSVETENIVKHLERAMGVPKTGTGSKWTFFVSHNKVGGFRQVILHNGRMIFTRLAQPIGESTPEVLAGNIEQEMTSTMEYMKRLAFDPQDGLDVYIVASGAIKSVLDASKFKANNFHIMTPFELAGYLGIDGATQSTDQFGDVVLAASISASRKHVLTLTTPESKKFDTLYRAYRFQRAAAAAVSLAILSYSGLVAYEIYDEFSTGEELEQSQRDKRRHLGELREEIRKTNIDVDKTGDVIDLYQLLLKQRSSPLEFFARARGVIKPPIVVKGVNWSLEDASSVPGAEGTPVKKTKKSATPTSAEPKMATVFTLEFPGVDNIDAFRVVSSKVLTDLKEIFKEAEYEVSFTKLPSRFSESEKLDMTFGDAPAQRSDAIGGQDVQLTIRQK